MIKKRRLILFVLTLPLSAIAAELSADLLAGKWLFTHMLLDGSSERSVNRLMEFTTDGRIINFDAAGNESGTASYAIRNDSIIYSDERGQQTWQVKLFSGNDLQADHSGALMFFQRQ